MPLKIKVQWPGGSSTLSLGDSCTYSQLLGEVKKLLIGTGIEVGRFKWYFSLLFLYIILGIASFSLLKYIYYVFCVCGIMYFVCVVLCIWCAGIENTF